MNATQQLDQVTGKIAELSAQRLQAGNRAQQAQQAIDDLQRQVTELRKRADLGADVGTSLATVEQLLTDERAALAESNRAAGELFERIAALQTELPKLQRAAIVERRDDLLPSARAALAEYRPAAIAYCKATAAARRALSQIAQLESANNLDSVIGARLLSESDIETGIRRAMAEGDPGLDALFNNWRV